MSYIGVEPVPKASRILTEGVLASSSQTISVPGGFTPDNIYVYINGSRLAQNDYDGSDGFTVDLGEVVPAGTEYVIEEIRSFEIPNHYTKAEVDATFADKTSSTPQDFTVMPSVGGDPIVESGSNADGEWTRWADGTQVCTGEVASGFDGNTPYPVLFVPPVRVVCTMAHGGISTAEVQGVGVGNQDQPDFFSHYPRYQVVGANGGGSGIATQPIEWVAHGRWK